MQENTSLVPIEELVTVPKSQIHAILEYSKELEAEVKRLKTQQFTLLSLLISIKDKLGLNEMANIASIREALQYTNKYWFKDTLTVLRGVLKSLVPGSTPLDMKACLKIDFDAFKTEFETIMPIVKEWDAEYVSNLNSQPNIIEDATPD